MLSFFVPALPPEPPDQLAIPAGRLGGLVAAGLQECEDLGLTGQRREVGGGRAPLVGHGIGAGVEEQGGDVDVALEGHAAEGRLALRVTEVDRGPCLEQHRDRLGLAVIGRQHQQGVTLGVLRVHRQAAFDQRGQAGRIPLAGELGGFFGERGARMRCHVTIDEVLNVMSTNDK